VRLQAGNSFEAAARKSYDSLQGAASNQTKETPKVTMHPCIALAITYIDEHLDERLSLDELASKAGLSVWRFCVVFRQHAGISPRRYIWGQRLRKVQSLLASGVSPASAALMAGFYDQSHLCRHFKNTCGMTPGQYVTRQRSAQAAANCSREREAA
jgi:AraC-like DNA-binding protein